MLGYYQKNIESKLDNTMFIVNNLSRKMPEKNMKGRV